MSSLPERFVCIAAGLLVCVCAHAQGSYPGIGRAATQAEVTAWLQGQAAAGSNALLLSTCNRCEIYWTGGPDLEAWFQDFASSRGAPLGDALLRLDGEAAIRHLFDVTSGLDSQVLGEAEVLGQVRRAHHLARAAGTTNRLIDTVLTAALVAGRRVRRETRLGRHPASVGSAAWTTEARARAQAARAVVRIAFDSTGPRDSRA